MISITAANLTEQQQKNVLQFKSMFRPQPDLSGHGTYPANLKEQKHCCMEEWAKIHHTENDYSKLLLQATSFFTWLHADDKDFRSWIIYSFIVVYVATFMENTLKNI